MAVSWEKARDLRDKYIEQINFHQNSLESYDRLATDETDPVKQTGYIKAVASCRENIAHVQGLVRQMNGEMAKRTIEGRGPPDLPDFERPTEPKPGPPGGNRDAIDKMMLQAREDQVKRDRDRDRDDDDERGR